MTDNFFSLSITEKYTKLADGKKNNNQFELFSFGKIETVNNFYTSDIVKQIDLQAEKINQLISLNKINKKNVNIIIPDHLTYSQILEMPLLNEKELISAMKYQADQFIPMPINEVNIDLEIIEEYKEEKKILILIVAAPKKIIEKIQLTIETAGLIPESIENELSAYSRFINQYKKSICEENSILVNFDRNNTNFAYYQKENFLLKEVHSIPYGFNLFLKEIMINVDSNQIKAEEFLKTYEFKKETPIDMKKIISPLIKELSLELKRFITNKTVNKIYFFNQIVAFPALVSFLEKEINLPINIINPFSLIKTNINLQSIISELPFYLEVFGGNLS